MNNVNISDFSINMKATGENIVQLMNKAGITVRMLQRFFDFENPNAIYKWRHGESLPTVDNLVAMAFILNVRMDDIVVLERRYS
ncbi:MAG TPA: helix-turn-helix domain-containing protein [Fusicatenibacter saccharivorans]|nr:helix-turn-helix domain-containing protein [Fusicatenibacter saccharivorans]